jgi:hypothetical protein
VRRLPALWIVLCFENNLLHGEVDSPALPTKPAVCNRPVRTAG